jgi:predicted pyridoxine 5'-phosphate oxidase superfamily flavin-nucleotide-binding protein
MQKHPCDVAFTPAVKAIQTAKGSRNLYAKVEERGGWETTVTEELAQFIGERDEFYLATANAEGQPYIQYRGGRAGFLRVIDKHTLGFADFGGNQQYVTLGNLSQNPKAFIFLMDYIDLRRIKLWGKARVVEDDPALVERLRDTEDSSPAERAILFEIEAWDMNCQQHIHRRFPQEIVGPFVEKLQARIQELQTQLSRTDAIAPAD